MKQVRKHLFSSLLSILLISLVTPTQLVNAQQINKVFDEIGGGGSSNSGSESGSGSTMYIVGGAIIAGVLIYALLREKKDPENKDTTAVLTYQESLGETFSYEQEVTGSLSKIPINLYLELQNEKAVMNEKKYIIGVSFGF